MSAKPPDPENVTLGWDKFHGWWERPDGTRYLRADLAEARERALLELLERCLSATDYAWGDDSGPSKAIRAALSAAAGEKE
jgi:hypothetical protein